MKNKNLAYSEGWVSIVLNIFLFAVKYYAGIMSGSIALIADSWHTLSDSFSSAIVIIGTKASDKPPDKEHPFGHGRAELIATIIMGSLLASVGLNFFFDSFIKLKERDLASFTTFAIIVTLISFISKEIMARYAFWVGKKIASPSVIADGHHHRSDAISSLIILISLFFGRYVWWIDGALGILVSFMIMYSAYEVLKGTINSLLGTEPDKEAVAKISAICNQHGIKTEFIHHIHLHNYGMHNEVTFHIRVSDKLSISEAHKISSEIEAQIKEELNRRVAPIISQGGGYIPMIDHLIPPDIPYENFTYYLKLKSGLLQYM